MAAAFGVRALGLCKVKFDGRMGQAVMPGRGHQSYYCRLGVGPGDHCVHVPGSADARGGYLDGDVDDALGEEAGGDGIGDVAGRRHGA